MENQPCNDCVNGKVCQYKEKCDQLYGRVSSLPTESGLVIKIDCIYKCPSKPISVGSARQTDNIDWLSPR